MSGMKCGLLWKVINGVLIAALGAMVVIVFVNACLRYFFNSGIPAGEELSRYFFVWVSALGAIIAYREGKHIGVDLLLATLHGTPRKVVALIGELLVMAAFILVLWGGWQFFLTSAASPGPATEIPFGFVSVSIIFVSVSIIVMSIANCIRLLCNDGASEIPGSEG